MGVQVDNKDNRLLVRGCLPLLPTQFAKILAAIFHSETSYLN